MFGTRADLGIWTAPDISDGGSIDRRTSTSNESVWSSVEVSASGGGMLFIGAMWCIAAASAPRSSGRCAGSPTSAFAKRASSPSGKLGSTSLGRRMAGPIGTLSRARRGSRRPKRRLLGSSPARGSVAARARGTPGLGRSSGESRAAAGASRARQRRGPRTRGERRPARRARGVASGRGKAGR